MRGWTLATTALALAVLALAVLALASSTWGAFSSTTSATGSFSAAPDLRAPAAAPLVIGKSAGGTSGYLKQGAGYYVYAQVSDSGSPASGTQTVTADVSAVTTGSTAAPLAAGSFSADGVSYNYRSALLTANGSLSPGSKALAIATADSAGNSGQANGTVTVDNTAPTASNIQVTNGGATAGKAEPGDTIVWTFSEPVEPGTILSGWNGASTNVVVRLRNGGVLASDDLVIYDSADSTQLALGTVDLAGTDYVGGLLGTEVARFGATGTASTMTMSGATVTVTLGSASGTAATTAGGNASASWLPSSSVTDRAGNSASTASATESGAADVDF